MGILQNIVGAFKNEKKSVPYSFLWNSGAMQSVITKSDALDFYKSWVFACVSRRSMGIAQLNFKGYKKVGNKIVEVLEHPVLDLLYRVNPEMTKFNFLQLSVIYRDMFGMSPWILERDSSGKVYQMFVARPEFFFVNRGKEGEVISYTYRIGAYKKDYVREDVLFLKNYNPNNPDKGIGLIEAVRMTAENDDLVVQSNSGLLKNSARPGGYFTTDEVLDDKEVKRAKKELNNKWGGIDNAFKTQILQGGLKFQPNIIPPKDLEYIEGRKFNRDEILAVFGVPKSLLTFDDVNRASAQAGEYQFNKWTLEPLAREIVEQINEFLVPKFDTNFWLDFEPLAKEDGEVILNKQKESVNKWSTINEVREIDGMHPVNGGDYIYMPFSLMPIVGGEKKTEVIKIEAVKSGEINLKLQNYILKRIGARNYKMNKLAEKVQKSIDKKLDNKKIILKIVNEDVKKKR